MTLDAEWTQVYDVYTRNKNGAAWQRQRAFKTAFHMVLAFPLCAWDCQGRDQVKGGLCFPMSISAMNDVWKSDASKGPARLVLLALADSANDDGYCWPSIAHLSRKCNMSPNSVRRSLAQLIGDGHIRRIERPGHSNRFLVTPLKNETPPENGRGTPPKNGRAPLPKMGGRTIIEPKEEAVVVVGAPDAIREYEQSIGLVTPSLQADITAACREFTAAWFIEATREAVKQNVRKWRYIYRILENWKRDGFKAERKQPRPNGRGSSEYNKMAVIREVLGASDV